MVVRKAWGYEKIIDNNEKYCGKILTVYPEGVSSSIHYHKKKEETFYVLKGSLVLEVYPKCDPEKVNESNLPSPEVRYMKEGDIIRLVPLVPHRFWAGRSEVAEFIEVSTTDDPNDSYRIRKSGPRGI